ncbi:hypothetical protein NLX67_21425 [Domibacillus sp. A3M-37]|nr:hypothetical protein [Domibacillus sp. A3M-37]MCP3764880.1 hypothetical protein [Domibacillus sp. A3M-37]
MGWVKRILVYRTRLKPDKRFCRAGGHPYSHFQWVLFSLVVQGLSVKPLLDRLGVNQKEEGNREYEELIARGHRLETAIKEIQHIQSNLLIHETISKEMTDLYRKELIELQQKIELLFNKYPDLKNKQQTILQKHSLYAQYEAIDNLLKEGIISNEVAQQEHDRITDEIVHLESPQEPI